MDQDTSMTDGFLSKLSKKDKEQYGASSGIISPEEASKMFTEEGGVALFATDEDRELIESITGKAKIATSDGATPSLKKKEAPVKTGKEEEDADILRSLMSQIGKSDGDGQGGDAIAGVDPDDIFGSNDGLGMMKMPSSATTPLTMQRQDTVADTTSNSVSTTSSTSLGVGSVSGAGGAMSEMTVKEPALTQKEADELQARLDNMTDEQIEAVFTKLRSSIGVQLQNELSESLVEEGLTGSNGPPKPKRDMPRVAPIDENVRRKYEGELAEVEQELEKMYNDPLGVWRDMLKKEKKESEGKE